MKHKIKIWLAISGVSALLLLLIFTALNIKNISAYFSDSGSKINTFVFGYNEIEIVEEFEEPYAVYPGDEIVKIVNVSNTGTVDCYVRVKAVFSHNLLGNHCLIDWNTNDWTKKEDGYWYYNHVLTAGTSTENLMTKVVISESMSEDLAFAMDEFYFSLFIYAESIQYEGFPSADAAWEFYNKEN